MARPSKYHTHVKPKLELIQGWASDGLTDQQIAEKLGISHDTFYTYKKQYSEFSEVLKKGKEVADYEVQNALFRAAIGFHYDEQSTTATGGVVTLRKFCKPNTSAQIFWLKNRCPDKWRDKTEVKQDVTQSVTFIGEDDILE